MGFLFWTCWIVDLLIVALAVLGRGFRASFGAGTALNTIVIGLCGLAVIAALVFRLAGRPKPAMIIVLVPLAALLVLYWMEERSEG